MSNKIDVQGQCLCGAVSVAAKSVNSNVGACHCDMCRKWGGGPLLAIDCQSNVEIKGANHVEVFPSSQWAERGFCKTCGTHLFYRLKQNKQYIIPVGLFNLDAALTFDHQIFIDSKPAYYCFSNKTKNMTGEEVFAQYSVE